MSWNIRVASERKQRTMMKDKLESIAIKSEEVPFSFRTKRGEHVVRPAPLACVTDLVGTIFHLLDEKSR